MIINTGGRTDTVQYYTQWLLRRFSEGYVLSRNPLFPNKVTRYEPVSYTHLDVYKRQVVRIVPFVTTGA